MHPYFEKNYVICPRCGSCLIKTDQNAHCRRCDMEIYPHPSPATAVFIRDDKRQVLLAKRRVSPKKGYWDAVGGFMKTNESIEECAIRETMEETGLIIKIEKVLGSYPDIYSGTPTLTVGLEASIVEGDPKAQDDVAVLQWFSLKMLPDKNTIAFNSVYALLNSILASE